MKVVKRVAATGLAVSLLIGCGGAPAAVASRPGSAVEPGEPMVIGYLASWGVRSKGLRIAEIPAERLTHLFYAFGGVSREGLAILGDPCLDVGECPAGQEPATPGGNLAALLELKQRHPHLKLLISLGGWGGSRYLSDAAATSEARQRFVASTIDLFLRRHPGLFDGIDVDWEFPVAGGMPENVYRPEDRENYTALMAEFRRQLDALERPGGQRYLLAIAASANPAALQHLEPQRLAQVLDWINVMTYDYHAGSRLAHFNAPLHATRDDPTPQFNVAESMRAYQDAGVPARQLVVGAPFYGRGYGSVPEANEGLFQPGDPGGAPGWGTGGIDYRVLVSQHPEAHGFRRFWHPEAQVPWLYNPQSGIWISYDDPASIRRKAEYVREGGFGGIMFWELGGDDGSLLRAVHEGLSATRPTSN